MYHITLTPYDAGDIEALPLFITLFYTLFITLFYILFITLFYILFITLFYIRFITLFYIRFITLFYIRFITLFYTLKWLKDMSTKGKITVVQADKGGAILIIKPDLLERKVMEKLENLNYKKMWRKSLQTN